MTEKKKDMSPQWSFMLRYLLVPLTAFMAGAGAMLWGIMRAGYLESVKGVKKCFR